MALNSCAANRAFTKRLPALALMLRAGLSLICWLLLALSTHADEPGAQELLDLELRIAYGGGVPHQWLGRIDVSAGEVSLVRVLGLEADTSGSVHAEDGALRIQQRGPRSYDGVDIAVRAPRSAKLNLALGDYRVEIPLVDLIAGVHNVPLDQKQNRLLVRRVPGDRLRVVLERDALVFNTGEPFRFSVQPQHAGLPSDTALKCRVRLIAVPAENEVWSGEADFRVDRTGAEPVLGPFECVLPATEGVYRIAIEIVQPPRLGVALVRGKPLLARDMQIVAIAPTSIDEPQKPFETLLEIDPAHPGWLDRLTRLTKLPAVPGYLKEPLGNGKESNAPHLDGTLVKLAVAGWQAYPLPIKNPNQPHILEVEYPSDAAMALGISIVEPNAAGQIAPLGVDSGVQVSEPLATSDKKLLKHRLVFWPRTKTPLVLLTNRHNKQVAWFGKLRVLHGPTALPSELKAEPSDEAGRLLAVYYDKPMFAENFGAAEALDSVSGRTLDDWTTFYLGAKRLIEHIKATGYNGAVISVACEGSTIYPSQLLAPTPKFDMGTFFANGQDPLRKDVLEMLFRMFDREGLQLVPAIQFSTPLVELEQQRRGDGEAIGLELLGNSGQPWLVARGARRGLAPYYNPLDERVRDAMRRVVDELAERYSHHAAFGGVSLQLSPETYAQLPGHDWGYDDVTITRFESDTKHVITASGPGRFAQRSRTLLTTERDTWLAWRARQMASLYMSMERDLIRRRGSAKLYLAGGEMFHSEELLKSLRPTLPAQANVRDAMLAIGIDPQLLHGENNIVLLRPQRIFAPGNLAAQGSHWELNRARELDEAVENAPVGGVHFFHEPATLRLPEFDAASPWGAANTYLLLATQFAPSDLHNRQRFAHSLAAADAECLVDGGWMVPLGQDEATRRLFAVYRELPSIHFDLIEPTSTTTQPVVGRKAVHRGALYAYFVNTAAYPVSVRVDLQNPDQGPIIALGGPELAEPVRSGDAWSITLELAPYDMQAILCSSARAQVSTWQCTVPRNIQDDLRRQVDQLRARVISLSTMTPIQPLSNAGFESPTKSGEIPGWVQAQDAGVKFTIDRADAIGTQALLLKSSGPVAWLRSEPFAPPATGRLSIVVQLKIADPAVQPPLRLAIEARHRDKTYYRFATVGAGPRSKPLTAKWDSYVFDVSDLPTEELSDLRVGFDLMGAGEVAIDDVQIYDRYFPREQQTELLKIMAVADLHLGKGRFADCQRVLDGYWPKFLLEHVPLDVSRVVSTPPAKSEAEPVTTPSEDKTSVRERVWSWVPKWR
ncbi:MAG TPA: hypothetical protein VL096_19640 [Pirellulaceae bacterium]|nr:hypothetical protein [Pirellulaceae bacterium]